MNKPLLRRVFYIAVVLCPFIMAGCAASVPEDGKKMLEAALQKDDNLRFQGDHGSRHTYVGIINPLPQPTIPGKNVTASCPDKCGGRSNDHWWPPLENRTFLLCQKPDISILP